MRREKLPYPVPFGQDPATLNDEQKIQQQLNQSIENSNNPDAQRGIAEQIVILLKKEPGLIKKYGVNLLDIYEKSLTREQGVTHKLKNSIRSNFFIAGMDFDKQNIVNVLKALLANKSAFTTKYGKTPEKALESMNPGNGLLKEIFNLAVNASKNEDTLLTEISPS